MRKYCKLVGLLLAMTMALSICAAAGSIVTVKYVTKLNGVSDTFVHGSITYDRATNTFVSVSLSFVGNSVFRGVKGTVTSRNRHVFSSNRRWADIRCPQHHAQSPGAGSYSADGSITKGLLMARWHKPQSVPEGGTALSYLLSSGLVLVGGIWLAGKQRRTSLQS